MAPKFACFLCQEYTEHQTKNCPNLKCMSCGQLGHARKDCQSIPNSESRSLSETEPGNTNESHAKTESIGDREEPNEEPCLEAVCQSEEIPHEFESQSKNENEEIESQSNESDMEEGELNGCDEICEICNSESILEIDILTASPFSKKRCIKYKAKAGKKWGDELASFLKCGNL